MGRVAVVGSANMDLIVRTTRFPLPGETVLGGVFATEPGGKGANQACASAQMGAATSFVGAVGKDAFGPKLSASMVSCGVDLTYLLELEAATGIAAITVTHDGENTIVVAPGANAHLTGDDVRQALLAMDSDFTVTQLEIPMDAVEAAAGFGRWILNPAPASALPAELLARVDVLTPNQSETQLLTGIRPTDDDSCLRAAAKLLDQGVRHVVITLGEQGCFLATAKYGRHFPTLQVRPVDTTGAGDAFNGALAAFLSEGREIANAILLANSVAALSTLKVGAQSAIPTRAELREAAPELF